MLRRDVCAWYSAQCPSGTLNSSHIPCSFIRIYSPLSFISVNLKPFQILRSIFRKICQPDMSGLTHRSTSTWLLAVSLPQNPHMSIRKMEIETDLARQSFNCHPWWHHIGNMLKTDDIYRFWSWASMLQNAWNMHCTSRESRFSHLLRWFEVGCAIWAQMRHIGVSQIKAPTGSIFQKYVYSSFMVKIRIGLGSFRLFWFIFGLGIMHEEGICQI